jgi:predicted aldo/keto reductase-like oxidoreductase
VWSHPEVSLVLSGMTAMQHVEENLDSADRSRIGGLTAEELALVDRVRDAYRELSPIPCTACRYCMPCPQGVDIPGLFALYNAGIMYDNLTEARRSYGFTLPQSKADRCVACRQCEEACPQQIEIVEWLRKIHSSLEG